MHGNNIDVNFLLHVIIGSKRVNFKNKILTLDFKNKILTLDSTLNQEHVKIHVLED